MSDQTVDAPEQPPTPVPCGICGLTDHPTGNHNGSGPAKAVADDPDGSDGNHNGSKAEP